MIRPSPFLAKKNRWIAENDHAFIFDNEYPVIKGHVLIVPKREIENFSDINSEEWADIKFLAEKYVSDVKAAAFNLALNNGELSGQSVAHLHFHLFPHFDDGAGMPKGGYCNAFGNLPDYYKRG